MSQPLSNVRDLTESDWEVLVSRIKTENCTPILGAGVSHPPLPLAGELAERLADAFNYPFAPKPPNGNTQAQPNPPGHTLDLAEVAQFIAVDKRDGTFPKERIQAWFREIPPPDFSADENSHRILASLNIPVYITTNYDDYMFQALERQGKKPARAICMWNEQIEADPQKFVLMSEYEPTIDRPVVFHLHGHLEIPESMVLTEDDYLDFLVAISQTRDLLPPVIAGRFGKSTLLVLGYGLKDWNFRVLLRGVMATVSRSQRKLRVTVQFPPGEQVAERINYLTQYYYQGYALTACFETTRDFIQKLREKCK